MFFVQDVELSVAFQRSGQKNKSEMKTQLAVIPPWNAEKI